jgi:hypothetical protein
VKVFEQLEDFAGITLKYYLLHLFFKYDRAFQIFQKAFSNLKITTQRY